MDSGRVLNITIDRAGILEYGDVSQLQEMFIDYNDQRTSIYNKDPFGTNGTSIVPMKAELPEDFRTHNQYLDYSRDWLSETL